MTNWSYTGRPTRLWAAVQGAQRRRHPGTRHLHGGLSRPTGRHASQGWVSVHHPRREKRAVVVVDPPVRFLVPDPTDFGTGHGQEALRATRTPESGRRALPATIISGRQGQSYRVKLTTSSMAKLPGERHHPWTTAGNEHIYVGSARHQSNGD